MSRSGELQRAPSTRARGRGPLPARRARATGSHRITTTARPEAPPNSKINAIRSRHRAQWYPPSRNYTRYKFFRGHYDFATSVGFDISHVRTLPHGSSDHLPILVTAESVAAARPEALAG